MKRIGKIFIILSFAVLILWIVPWLYRIVTLKSYTTPFTLYSCVYHDFTRLDRSDGKEFRFIDRNGNVYGDEAQPLFYHNVLSSKGMLPDTLEGRAVTPAEIDANNIIVTAEMKEIKRIAPKAYLLMESVPVRLELQDPEYAFVPRKDGLYIYEMAENRLDETKSAAFNDALRAAGFSFPARLCAGNPSDRKEYDEGYLLTDADGKLFQLKMTDGAPEVRHFSAADGLDLEHLIITELKNRATLGYLVGRDQALYMLRPDGSVVPTQVRYNPFEEDFMLIGDLFYYTVRVSDDEGEHFYALRSDDFSLVDTMDRPYAFEEETNLCEYLFPCRLYFTSSDDGFFKPRFTDWSWKGLIVDLVLAAAWILWRRSRKNTKN